MLFKRILLPAIVACAMNASSLTYSITADSYYPAPDNPTQADAYLVQSFPFELSEPTTLTFSATYSQTPLSCNDSPCVQDLNTYAEIDPGLPLNGTPDKGICDKTTGALFPCSATLSAGSYELFLEINDTRATRDLTKDVVYPFSDTISLTMDGFLIPEPSSLATGLLGLCLGFIGLLARRRIARRIVPAHSPGVR